MTFSSFDSLTVMSQASCDSFRKRTGPYDVQFETMMELFPQNCFQQFRAFRDQSKGNRQTGETA